MGNNEKILELFVASEEWEEAFNWVEKHPEFKEMVYVPYANTLAEQDKFLQAQKAFHKAGKPDEAFRVLEQLTMNAVNENRFDDAGYYYWMLSMQCLELSAESESEEETSRLMAKFKDFQKRASMYYVYHTIQRYMDEPFTSYMPEALFNISRYLMHELMNTQPPGISSFSTLYTLAKQSRNLEAYKLARYVLDKLQSLRIPSRFQEDVDLAALKIQTKPFHDSEEHQPLCYRCSTTSPLVNNVGNQCSNCGHPFVYSYVSFEILPLVEFVLEEGISDEEAVRLILATSGGREPETEEKPEELDEGVEVENQWTASEVNEHNLGINGSNSLTTDPFSSNYMNFYQGGSDFQPVSLNRLALTALEPHEVIICRWPKPLHYQFYKNLMTDVPITHCEHCNKMFHTDDYILQVLQKGYCPFCRTPSGDLLDDDIDY